MTEIPLNWSWTAEHALDDEGREAVRDAYRLLLATPPEEVLNGIVEETVDLDFEGIRGIVLQLRDDGIATTRVYVSHDDYPDLAVGVDEARDCELPHEWEFGMHSLAVLGERQAKLEADLVETALLMCDLPDHEGDLIYDYIVGEQLEIESRTCYDGTILFAFAVYVSPPIRTLYQEYQYEIANRMGIPLDKTLLSRK